MITGTKDGYELSTDLDRLDVGLVHHWLSTDAFWALGRSREAVERSVRHSLNFAVYDVAGSQVAYARVVTDWATFAWLCDVYVAPAHRGKGLGTWLARAARDHLAPLPPQARPAHHTRRPRGLREGRLHTLPEP